VTLENSDMKIVSSVTSVCMAPAVVASAHPSALGFVPGRDVVENIVVLDGLARLYDMECCLRNPSLGGKSVMELGGLSALSMLPLLLFFDIAAAFPSFCARFLDKCS